MCNPSERSLRFVESSERRSDTMPDPERRWVHEIAPNHGGGSQLAVDLHDKWALAISISNDDRFDRLVIRHDLAVDD